MTTAQEHVLKNLRAAIAEYAGEATPQGVRSAIQRHYGWANRAIPNLLNVLTPEEGRVLAAIIPR